MDNPWDFIYPQQQNVERWIPNSDAIDKCFMLHEKNVPAVAVDDDAGWFVFEYIIDIMYRIVSDLYGHE